MDGRSRIDRNPSSCLNGIFLYQRLMRMVVRDVFLLGYPIHTVEDFLLRLRKEYQRTVRLSQTPCRALGRLGAAKAIGR